MDRSTRCDRCGLVFFADTSPAGCPRCARRASPDEAPPLPVQHDAPRDVPTTTAAPHLEQNGDEAAPLTAKDYLLIFCLLAAGPLVGLSGLHVADENVGYDLIPLFCLPAGCLGGWHGATLGARILGAASHDSTRGAFGGAAGHLFVSLFARYRWFRRASFALALGGASLGIAYGVLERINASTSVGEVVEISCDPRLAKRPFVTRACFAKTDPRDISSSMHGKRGLLGVLRLWHGRSLR